MSRAINVLSIAHANTAYALLQRARYGSSVAHARSRVVSVIEATNKQRVKTRGAKGAHGGARNVGNDYNNVGGVAWRRWYNHLGSVPARNDNGAALLRLGAMYSPLYLYLDINIASRVTYRQLAYHA